MNSQKPYMGCQGHVQGYIVAYRGWQGHTGSDKGLQWHLVDVYSG